MNNKYEFTGVEKDGLKQIRALRSFGTVVKGDIGGWIADEKNLSPEGDAWVFGNAWVFGYARVYGDAWVFGDARVFGNAQVSGNARVSGDAQVFGNAWVFGYARVYGDARVSGDAQVYGNAQVSGNARVFGDAQVYGYARVVYGPFNGNSTTDFKAAILATLRVLPVGSDYILYKRVNKVRDGVFVSCHDSSFKYVTGQESSVDNPSTDPLVSCGSGLHVADPLYWQGGDTLIACQFRLEDVLAVQEGKVRVRRLLCLGEVTV